LFKEISQVGEQKSYYLLFAIVKTPGIPKGVIPSLLVVEKLVHGTVKSRQALHLIFYAVGVYNIHEHTDAGLMCLVYQVLEIIRGAEPGRGGKK
jgi:hypothetical protein